MTSRFLRKGATQKHQNTNIEKRELCIGTSSLCLDFRFRADRMKITVMMADERFITLDVDPQELVSCNISIQSCPFEYICPGIVNHLP